MFDVFFRSFVLIFFNIDLVVDIFVQQFFLFILPTVSEVFDELH